MGFLSALYLDLRLGFEETSPDAPGVGPVSGHEGRREQRRHGLVKQEVILVQRGVKRLDRKGSKGGCLLNGSGVILAGPKI